ncbi:Glycine N-acyltransferase, partial [Galemys pyrenaicus]
QRRCSSPLAALSSAAALTPQLRSLSPNPTLRPLGSTPQGMHMAPSLLPTRLGSQSSLNEAIQSLAAAKSLQVTHSQNILYMWVETVKKLVPSLLDRKVLAPTGGKPRAIDEALFRPSSLDVAHAALVNKFWAFGGNEKSLRFIERCIRTFPSFCLLGPEGTPVCWDLMDQTGELRMAATLPEYRSQGLISYIIHYQEQALNKLGFPIYSHVNKNNISMQKMSYALHYIPMPCDWNQWHCVPL